MNRDDRKILKEQMEKLQKYLDDMPSDLNIEELEIQNIIDELDERISNAIGGMGDELEEQKSILERAVSSLIDAQSAMEEAIELLQETIDGIESLL